MIFESSAIYFESSNDYTNILNEDKYNENIQIFSTLDSIIKILVIILGLFVLNLIEEKC